MSKTDGKNRMEQMEIELRILRAAIEGDEELRAYIHRELPADSMVEMHDAYRAICGRYEAGEPVSIDVLRLCEDMDLVQKGRVESLANVPLHTDRSTIDKLISKIRSGFRRHQVIVGLRPALTAIAQGKKTPETAVSEMLDVLQNLSVGFNRSRDITVLGDSDMDVSDLLNLVFSGSQEMVPLGYAGFDDQCGGAGLGDLIIINAITGSGKTTFMLDSARRIVEKGHSVGFFSLELDGRSIVKRFVSNVARIPFSSLWNQAQHSDELRESVISGYNSWRNQLRMAKGKLHIVDDPEIRIADIAATARSRRHKVVFIDYLNLLTEGDGERYERLGTLARDLKIMARRLNVAVIVAVQKDEETGKIRYAREIKEHADVVLGWDGVTNDALSGTRHLEVHVEKGRNIRHFSFLLCADFEHMRMKDMSATRTVGNAASAEQKEGLVCDTEDAAQTAEAAVAVETSAESSATDPSPTGEGASDDEWSL